MGTLLIVNSENKAIPETISKFLNQHYQISITHSYQEAIIMIDEHFFDLFLVITTEIDMDLVQLLDEIKKDRHILLPVIVSLPKIDESSQAKAFSQRIFHLVEYPFILEELESKLAEFPKISDVINDIVITLSTRKYDKDYRLKQIIYFERSRPRCLRILYEENGEILSEEIFFRASLAKFATQYNLTRHFVQVHQSYLVNTRFVQKFDKAGLEVHLTTGKTIPLGSIYYKKIKKGVDEDDR